MNKSLNKNVFFALIRTYNGQVVKLGMQRGETMASNPEMKLLLK